MYDKRFLEVLSNGELAMLLCMAQEKQTKFVKDIKDEMNRREREQ